MPFAVSDTRISAWLNAAVQGTNPEKLQLLNAPDTAWLEYGPFDGAAPRPYLCYGPLAEAVTTLEEVYDIAIENNLIIG
jgi:hypothetical protein